jgi:DUF4097 and DUF4098 domain-containing protein YvlB
MFTRCCGGRSVTTVTGDGVGPGSPVPVGLQITSRSGRVVVSARAVERPEVVSGPAEIDADGVVRADGRGRIDIACPPGTDVAIGIESGRVECRGRLGRVAVTSTSGRVVIEEAREVEVRSSSGRVEVGRCHGACRVASTSGRVEIDSAESIDVTVSTGRLRASQVGDVSVSGGSGSVDLGLARPGIARVRVVSGSVTVAVPDGIAPRLELHAESGRTISEIAEGADGTLTVETSSGRIRVVRA